MTPFRPDQVVLNIMQYTGEYDSIQARSGGVKYNAHEQLSGKLSGR